MTITTPPDKFKPRLASATPKSYVTFWRAYPNGEAYPAQLPLTSADLFYYSIETPGFGFHTVNNYKRKGYRPIEIVVSNMRNPFNEDQLAALEKSDDKRQVIMSLATEVQSNWQRYQQEAASYVAPVVVEDPVAVKKSEDFRIQAEKIAKKEREKKAEKDAVTA